MLGGPGCQALEGKKGVHEAFAKFLGATACLQPDWGRQQDTSKNAPAPWTKQNNQQLHGEKLL